MAARSSARPPARTARPSLDKWSIGFMIQLAGQPFLRVGCRARDQGVGKAHFSNFSASFRRCLDWPRREPRPPSRLHRTPPCRRNRPVEPRGYQGAATADGGRAPDPQAPRRSDTPHTHTQARRSAPPELAKPHGQARLVPTHHGAPCVRCGEGGVALISHHHGAFCPRSPGRKKTVAPLTRHGVSARKQPRGWALPSTCVGHLEDGRSSLSGPNGS